MVLGYGQESCARSQGLQGGDKREVRDRQGQRCRGKEEQTQGMWPAARECWCHPERKSPGTEPPLEPLEGARPSRHDLDLGPRELRG